MRKKEKFTKKLSQIDQLLDGILLLVLFLAGVCRYRSVIVLSIMMILRFIIDEKKKYFVLLLTPILILALLTDIKSGQYFPLFPSLNPLLSVVIFVILEYVLVEYVKTRITSFFNNKVFTVCPSCYYNNGNPVSTCGNCEYEYDHLENRLLAPANNSTIGPDDSITGLTKRISSRKKVALCLRCNETILGNIRISPFRGVYKNGSKLHINSLIITASRVILIKYGSIAGGWKSREDLAIRDIISVEIKRKWHHSKEVNLLVFELRNNDVYELFYSAFDSSNYVLGEILNCIKIATDDGGQ